MFSNTLPELGKELKRVSHEMETLIPNEWKKGAVGEIIKDVMSSRGKGLRPSLMLLMAKIGNQYSGCENRIYRLGALTEFIHMASLIHDDVIDDSLMRRGNRTIQAKYGKNMAVYTGDLLLSQVVSITLQDNLIESGKLLAQTIQDMCMGEINQAFWQYKSTVTQEDYYQNIYGKTASMFVTVCKIASIESGCSNELISLMGEIGLHIGYLFQIRDDLLDFSLQDMGDKKSLRLDFQEGILTLPVIYSLKNSQCKAELEDLIEQARLGFLSDSDLTKLDTLIIQAGGFEQTIIQAENHRNKVSSLLNQIPTSEDKIKPIQYLISKLTLPKLSKK